ncbi:MAG TPA: hypothetical protein PKN20_00160 [Verrucomicrobiota bacterium]|mgnify:CR=1 FL=1|jgi:hypothetical protein|nr:hypothetical protein [Verrucomicrobiota bacterium]HOH39757.1 hypothetical protein [Verrucomicrobiota bacterium]
MKPKPANRRNWRQRCRQLRTLAAHSLKPIGLRYQRTRTCRFSRGNPFIDTLFQSSRLWFSKWHVCCQDSPELTLDQAATEVGIAHGSGNRVALLITTGRINPTAAKYATIVSATSQFSVILLRSADLKAPHPSRSDVARVIRAQALLALLAA